jgi:hypothetical protein
VRAATSSSSRRYVDWHLTMIGCVGEAAIGRGEHQYLDGGSRAEGTRVVAVDVDRVLLPCILSDEVGRDWRRW